MILATPYYTGRYALVNNILAFEAPLPVGYEFTIEDTKYRVLRTVPSAYNPRVMNIHLEKLNG